MPDLINTIGIPETPEVETPAKNIESTPKTAEIPQTATELPADVVPDSLPENKNIEARVEKKPKIVDETTHKLPVNKPVDPNADKITTLADEEEADLILGNMQIHNLPHAKH